MKKIIVLLVFAVLGMSFTLPEDSSAPPIPAYWAFTIKWDPSNCSCGTIIDKRLTYTIVNTTVPCEVDGETYYQVTGTEFSNSGNNDCLDVDCGNCYTVSATIYYIDNSGVCCSETENTTWSGTELNNGTAELLIEM